MVALIHEWVNRDGRVEQRDEHSDLGGTMRLGGQDAELLAGTLVRQIYGEARIFERHRHRYEVNNHYVPRLQQAGLRFSGLSMDTERLTEMIELPGHPWFVACQFHPEFTSTPRAGHPLFKAFIEAAARYSAAKERRAGTRSGRRGKGGTMKLCGFEVGIDRPLFLISGPCVIESRELAMDVAGQLKDLCAELKVPFIFKASYDKANRSSGGSFRGLGMDKGLEILADVRKTIGVPVLTDVHAIEELSRPRPRPSTCCRRPRSCAARPISSVPPPRQDGR